MSPISSNALFHFTDHLDHVVDILTNEFRPHYSLEDHSMFFGAESGPKFRWALPMVCFCDLPLSQTAQHMSTYGQYAIGMSKEWGMRSGVAPVLYTYSESPIAKILEVLSDASFEGEETAALEGRKPAEYEQFNNVVDRLGDFLKPYEGDLLRGAGKPKLVRFYDEREWRFAPIGDSIDAAGVLDYERFQDPVQRAAANRRIRERSVLRFDPSDIRYIVVARESEIVPLVKRLREIKAKYCEDQVLLLASRIITATQIAEDF